jgi:ABC-type oligopeptide transport system substrate-binding subunit
MYRSKRWQVLLAVLSIAVILLSACAPAATAPAAPAGGEAAAEAPAGEAKTLRVNLNTFPDMLDPQKEFVRQ